MTTRGRTAVFLMAFLTFALLACPPSQKADSKPSEPCARVGQTCEFSPGKLGTCVAKDGCTDTTNPACFVCQSQH